MKKAYGFGSHDEIFIETSLGKLSKFRILSGLSITDKISLGIRDEIHVCVYWLWCGELFKEMEYIKLKKKLKQI